MSNTPPGLSNATSLRNARGHWLGRTCCHTALSHSTSNCSPSPEATARSGSWSSSQQIRETGWRRVPALRNLRQGSSAITSRPHVASQAASRPVPAPRSRTSPGKRRWRLAEGHASSPMQLLGIERLISRGNSRDMPIIPAAANISAQVESRSGTSIGRCYQRWLTVTA